MEGRIAERGRRPGRQPRPVDGLINGQDLPRGRAVVQHTRVLYLEMGPEFALECVWECLDTRFRVTKRPSQQLFHDLLKGPKISASQPQELFLFAQDCSMAVKLQSWDPNAMLTWKNSPIKKRLSQDRTADSPINGMTIGKRSGINTLL